MVVVVAATADAAGSVVSSSLSLFTPFVVELPFAETMEGADGAVGATGGVDGSVLVEAGMTGGAICAVIDAGVGTRAIEGA